MRKVVALAMCLAISGCKEAEVVSSFYKRVDGSVAFYIERYEHGFNLQAADLSGRPSRTLMKVSMCGPSKLLWDGKDSVLFTHTGAEIIYYADGFDKNSKLTIAVCKLGSLSCDSWPESSTKETIAISCG